MTPSAELVDVHAHFVTDDYVAAAKAGGHEHPDGMPGWPSWSRADHLKFMDEAGIARSMLSISSPGVHFGDDAAARSLARAVNEAGSAIARADPARFGHFASLPLPDVDGSLTELAHALDELGSDGVTFETNSGGTYLGDARYEPLWAELDRRQTIVFVHPTSPPCADVCSLGRPRPMLEFVFDTTRAVSDLVFTGVLSRNPGIRWIFTHGGGTLPLLADRLELFRTVVTPGGAPADDVPTVQAQLRGLWFDIAGTPFPNQVPALVRAFGSGRVLYGSDYCWTPAAGLDSQVASIDSAAPPDGDEGTDSWRALTTRNAGRLFGRG